MSEANNPRVGQQAIYHRCSIDRQTMEIGGQDEFLAVVTSVINDRSVNLNVTDAKDQVHTRGGIIIWNEGDEALDPDTPYAELIID